MNHDITHCKGDNCSKRDHCMRYKAHDELQRPNKRGLYSYLLSNNGNDCLYFLEL